MFVCGKEKPLKLRSSQDLNLSLPNSGQMLLPLSHWSSGIRAEIVKRALSSAETELTNSLSEGQDSELRKDTLRSVLG